ncbi:MAG TPA: pyridoxal-phosphate dependent enzyme [Streptosporangiaceae bacterium]|nr:pyridoxal-phosphate dependent enzyme [Streptosporangiaceae bacterium]
MGTLSVGAVRFSDVLRAQVQLAGRIRRTPMAQLPTLSVLLKCESAQATGSFKFRGALNAVIEDRPDQVVAGSSGNHGIALARAARMAGATATIFMTADSDPWKRQRIQREAGVVELCEGGNDARDECARAHAQRTGASLISAYEHPAAIAGNGTVGLEVIAQAPDVTDLFVPVGTGGLLAGVCLAVRGARSAARVVGVEPAGADDFVRSVSAGRRVQIDAPETICDGARAQRPGALAFRVAAELVDDVIAVPDSTTLRAWRLLASLGIRAEPTGALALAGLLTSHRVGAVPVAIVSGGNMSGERRLALQDPHAAAYGRGSPARVMTGEPSTPGPPPAPGQAATSH